METAIWTAALDFVWTFLIGKLSAREILSFSSICFVSASSLVQFLISSVFRVQLKYTSTVGFRKSRAMSSIHNFFVCCSSNRKSLMFDKEIKKHRKQSNSPGFLNALLENGWGRCAPVAELKADEACLGTDRGDGARKRARSGSPGASRDDVDDSVPPNLNPLSSAPATSTLSSSFCGACFVKPNLAACQTPGTECFALKCLLARYRTSVANGEVDPSTRGTRWIAFDTETSGFGSASELLQLGGAEFFTPDIPAANFEDETFSGYRGRTFQTLVKPSANVSIHPMALSVNRLRISDLDHAPSREEVMRRFKDFVLRKVQTEDEISRSEMDGFVQPDAVPDLCEELMRLSPPVAVVAHNSQFDMEIIRKSFADLSTQFDQAVTSMPQIEFLEARTALHSSSTAECLQASASVAVGSPPATTDCLSVVQIPCFCTMRLFKELYPGQPASLDLCCQFFGLHVEPRARDEPDPDSAFVDGHGGQLGYHNALTDSIMTAKLFLKLLSVLSALL
jgi:DNA polymerase III epsilon subunit-like protein